MLNKIDKENLVAKLKSHDQEHLVQFWEELSENEQEILYFDLIGMDVASVCSQFARAMEERETMGQKLDAQMSPIPVELCSGTAQASQKEVSDYEAIGLNAIGKSEVGVLLLAGGQGTRLGVAYPKGMYSVGLPSKKTLFQIQAERLIKVKELAAAHNSVNNDSVQLPWYIMVSEQTLDMTKEFFRKHSHFGMRPEDVVFFEQGTLPCFANDGKIILGKKYKVSRAPDGNGGLYKALVKQSVLEDMSRRGIKYLHIYCVDNVLIKMADPVFTGFAIAKNANCASKAVKKVDPEEKVGVICRVNQRYQVVEYSEISESTRNLRTSSDGDLVYNAGNICNHFVTTEFLSELCRNHEHELKHHIAEKKIPFVDEHGIFRKPLANNGIKLEKFVFDIFPFSQASWAHGGNFLVWEVSREDEFSPLKNGADAKSDNPDTCRTDLMEKHLKWLLKSGAHLQVSFFNASPTVEISSLVSYDGENLAEVLQGKTFKDPLFIDYDLKTRLITFNELSLDEYRLKYNV